MNLKFVFILLLFSFFSTCENNRAQKNKEKKTWLGGFFWITGNKPSAAKNLVIMADDALLKPFFKDNKEGVRNLAEKLSSENKGVVVHLGNQIIFDAGGEFFDSSSKENLKMFTDILHSKNKKVYLWFLDSFGSDAFSTLYGNYNTTAIKLKSDLDKYGIYYDGIAIDIEWINLSSSSTTIDNSAKYLEILSSVKSIFIGKEILAFVPFIDNKSENFKRGYNEDSMKSLDVKALAMLYIKDGGFISKNGFPDPALNDSRVDQIKKYLQSNSYSIAVGIEKGLLINRNNEFSFIKNITNAQNDIYKNLSFQEEKSFTYYIIKRYTSLSTFTIIKNNGISEQISKDEQVYIFENKRNLLQEEDFIWEHFKSDF